MASVRTSEGGVDFPHHFPYLFPPGPGFGPDPRSEAMSGAFGEAQPSPDPTI